MHVVMVGRGSKTTVARAFVMFLSFGIVSGRAWQESPIAAIWGTAHFWWRRR